MYCTNCGTPNVDGVKFCSNCGAAFQSAPQPVPQQPAHQPIVRQNQPDMNMAGSNVKKVPVAAKVLGWISMVLSCLGIIGMLLIVIATAMPSYQGSSAMIHSEDVSKAAVFFFGEALGLMLSPVGSLLGIISMIIMLTKRNRKMIWLPITGAAIGFIALFGTILASVNLIESLS